eukprot:s1893_g6.t2
MFCQTLKGSDTLFRYWRTLAEASQSNVPLCAGGGCPIVGGWRLWCCRWYWPPQASVVVVAAARRWLCQQHLASRWAEAATAAVRLQALVRGWLCRRFVAAERQRQEAACTVKSFLQRWLSRKALLDALVLQDDAPAAEVDDDSLYSSDYEAGSSPSRSRAQSPTAGSGASSWDPFIAALKGDSPIKAEDQMTTSDHVTQGPSSPLRERHASRWEGHGEGATLPWGFNELFETGRLPQQLPSLDAALQAAERRLKTERSNEGQELYFMARLLRGTIHQQGLALNDEAVEKTALLGCDEDSTGPCYGEDRISFKDMNDYYSTVDAERFDWYGTWDTDITWDGGGTSSMGSVLRPFLRADAEILMVGCGRSEMSQQMYREGAEMELPAHHQHRHQPSAAGESSEEVGRRDVVHVVALDERLILTVAG